jgi:hypothetical protein
MTRANDAVLVMGFNRPDLLTVLLDRLREIGPERVYLAVDGPRPDRAGEAERVQACRDLAADIDWGCSLRTLFQERNLGCGRGVSTAISWFFEHEERGIILEDDIIADPTFFAFCSELLDRYEEDLRVFAVSGCNYVPTSAQSHPEEAYRFSQVPHVWGWATWRRSWAQHQLDITGWRSRLPLATLWRRSGHSIAGTAFWAATFRMLARKEIDTWDGQLVLAAMASGQLTAISNTNLVHNVGFGANATHTLVEMDELMPVEPIELPTQPVVVRLDAKADAWTRKNHFGATMTGMAAKAIKYARLRKDRSKT